VERHLGDQFIEEVLALGGRGVRLDSVRIRSRIWLWCARNTSVPSIGDPLFAGDDVARRSLQHRRAAAYFDLSVAGAHLQRFDRGEGGSGEDLSGVQVEP
jgi:hypothetical protein